MDDRTKKQIVEVFNKHILSPVLYMLEFEEVVDLICFCDRNVKISDIYDAEQALFSATGRSFEIVDVQEFNAAERLDMTQNAELIYSANRLVAHIFEQAMAEDYKKMMKEREAARIRYEDNQSPFLQ